MTLRIKVLFPLVFFSALLTAYLFGYWMPRSLDATRADVQSAAERHLDSVTEGLIPLLLGGQLDAIYENLDALLARNRDWVSIGLHDTQDRSLYPLKEVSLAPETRPGGEVHMLRRRIEYGGTPLGILSVAVDFTPWLDKASKRLYELALVLLAVIGAFFASAAILLERLVLKPVNVLSKAATALAQNQFGVPLEKRSSDEVGNLVGRFADMRDAILGYQTKLRTSEHQFRTLAGNLPDIVARFDTDCRCTYVNPEFERVSRMPAAALLDKTPAEVRGVSGANAALLKEKLAAAMASGEACRIDLSWIEGGKPVYWFVRILPEFSASGTVVSALAIGCDITERKRAEDALRRYQDELEQTVLKRTAELSLARDAAEAANKAKSTFLANMSHELRTPLNAVLGFSSLMRREPGITAGQREKLDIINRSGEHLLTLINDVLEMAKIEACRLHLEIAPLDLGRVMRDVAGMMDIRAREKGLLLLLDQSSSFPRYIKGDEARLRQILVNLTGNAVKFTKEGGVTIRLGMRPEDPRSSSPEGGSANKPCSSSPEGGSAVKHLIIEVEDTGPGIAPEDQSRLFQPFVQLAESSMQKGTGLGLAITRQFVELMGGTISLESTPGKGSIFRIELPVELVAEAAAGIEPEGAQAGEICGLEPGQPEFRILIAEDQRDNQVLLMRLMADIGLAARLAENGGQCVAMFEEWHPHLIWMDRRMPVMDGVEATRRIRELAGGREVKIVAVTASAFREERQLLLDAGMDDFVRKPYHSSEIYDALARHLGVKYLYRSGLAQAKPAGPIVLTPEKLAGLPAVMRQELRDALLSLDSERIAAAIQKVSGADAELGLTLARLAETFDYSPVLNALEAQDAPPRVLSGCVAKPGKLAEPALARLNPI